MKKVCESILRCPISRGKLTWKDGHLTSDDQQLTFPMVNGIPWLFKHHKSYLNQWRARSHFTLQNVERKINRLEQDLSAAKESSSVHQRLQLLLKGWQLNKKSYLQILGDIYQEQQGPHNVMLAIGDKMPATQKLDSYINTLFRDWSWGSDEASQHIDSIKRVTSGQPFGKTVILGAGSCRLAKDLHDEFKPEFTVALDINPLLLTAANLILKSQTIELCEFPISPFSMEQVAVPQTLQSKSAASDNFHFLFADAMNLPLQTKSVDTIVSPWFVDIIPQDLESTIRRINCALKDGGQWLNFGPLGFGSRIAQEQWTLDEFLQMVSDNGFKIEKQEQSTIPYLQSPHSGQSCSEKVVTFKAVKVAHAKEPKEYEYLPPYLSDWSEPIPMSHEFLQLKNNNQVYFEVLSTIDGQLSVNEIASIMSEHYGLTLEQAQESLVAYLTGIFEQSNFY